MTHSPRFLLDAIRDLFLRRPDLRGRIRFLHIGPPSEPVRLYAERLGLSDVYVSHGYVPHATALQLLRQADAAFVCLADSPAAERNDCVPQKVYEYLGSRKPVLALVPEGDAKDVLSCAGTAILCPPRDVRAIGSALEQLIDGQVQLRPDESFICSFERRSLAARLARVLDRATGCTDSMQCCEVVTSGAVTA